MIELGTTKYIIHAELVANGYVEKHDIIGAIFGQTEGLLGSDLDLRDLQKSGRIGRIDVELDNTNGKSYAKIILPSSLDKVETAILAATLETIDRVGPCLATVKVINVEDIRIKKRQYITNRAKELLKSLVDNMMDTYEITEEIKEYIRTEEIIEYGGEKLPSGPNIDNSDAIIIVEGRADVINLLRCGIKNAIAVEGTSIPNIISELSKKKTTTIFTDGDRGGELILKEALQTCDIDYIARAPHGREVEELSKKEIIKCLRSKIPIEQYIQLNANRCCENRNHVISEISRNMSNEVGIKHDDINELNNSKNNNLIDNHPNTINESNAPSNIINSKFSNCNNGIEVKCSKINISNDDSIVVEDNYNNVCKHNNYNDDGSRCFNVNAENYIDSKTGNFNNVNENIGNNTMNGTLNTYSAHGIANNSKLYSNHDANTNLSQSANSPLDTKIGSSCQNISLVGNAYNSNVGGVLTDLEKNIKKPCNVFNTNNYDAQLKYLLSSIDEISGTGYLKIISNGYEEIKTVEDLEKENYSDANSDTNIQFIISDLPITQKMVDIVYERTFAIIGKEIKITKKPSGLKILTYDVLKNGINY
jgi:5S rRNA maturation endonuclease (ribonuclease M5)